MDAVRIERVGFIGLGVMGGAMCRNLIAKGAWPVIAFDRDPEALARITGATAAGPAAELVAAAHAVIPCPPGGAEVRAVMGENVLRVLAEVLPERLCADCVISASSSPCGSMVTALGSFSNSVKR